MQKTQRKYIAGDNLMMEKPPIYEKDTSLYGFLLEGDKSKLQAIIDQRFNAVSGDGTTYKVLSKYVLLTYTNMEKAYSEAPDERNLGFISETEFIPWIPVAAFVNKEGEEKIDHFYFHPYLCLVNSALALLTGREIYGYPKSFGTAKIPSKPGDPLDFSVKVKAYKKFSPDTELLEHELATVTPCDSATGERTTLAGIEKLFERLLELIVEDLEDVGDGILDGLKILEEMDFNAYKQMFNLIEHPQLDQLLLKQMPDSSGDFAVYQAITHSPALIKNVTTCDCLLDDFKVTIFDLDTYPLARSLGLDLVNNSMTARHAFHVKFDFIASMPEEIYVAS